MQWNFGQTHSEPSHYAFVTPNQTGFTDCRCWAGSQTGPPGQPGEAASGNLYPVILHKASWQNHRPRLRAVTTHTYVPCNSSAVHSGQTNISNLFQKMYCKEFWVKFKGWHFCDYKFFDAENKTTSALWNHHVSSWCGHSPPGWRPRLASAGGGNPVVGYRLPPAGAQRSWLFSPSPPPPSHTPSAWSPEDAAAPSSPLQSKKRWKDVRTTVNNS